MLTTITKWVPHAWTRLLRSQPQTRHTASNGSKHQSRTPGSSFVAWLMIPEQMQHVLGAQEGPVSRQSVVFVPSECPRDGW